MTKIFKFLIDRFRLFVLELKFKSMETDEARAMRMMIEDIEGEKEK